jgi:FKBP-type peptidyl-prolyl cis-trans isomerase
MIKMMLTAASLFVAAACGGNDGVMHEIHNGEKADAAAAQQAADAMSREVQEPAQTLPSGLQLQFVRRTTNGELPMPTMNASVLVLYEGSFVDGGQVFDSSFARNEPAEFPMNAVVQGFSEAISHMRPGDEVIATFPGSLGYGARGSGPIPPNAALRFRIVLLAFQEPGGQPVRAPGQR